MEGDKRGIEVIDRKGVRRAAEGNIRAFIIKILGIAVIQVGRTADRVIEAAGISVHILKISEYWQTFQVRIPMAKAPRKNFAIIKGRCER